MHALECGLMEIPHPGSQIFAASGYAGAKRVELFAHHLQWPTLVEHDNASRRVLQGHMLPV